MSRGFFSSKSQPDSPADKHFTAIMAIVVAMIPKIPSTYVLPLTIGASPSNGYDRLTNPHYHPLLYLKDSKGLRRE